MKLTLDKSVDEINYFLFGHRDEDKEDLASCVSNKEVDAYEPDEDSIIGFKV